MTAAVARSWTGHRPPTWRAVAPFLLAAVVLAGIAVALVRQPGDASSSGSASTSAATRDDKSAAPIEARDAAGGATAAGTGSTSAPLPALERVVRTGTLRLRVGTPVADVAERAASVAAALGGFVASSSSSSSGYAELTLRVPAARFDDARRQLSRLGRVEGSELAGEDVGGQLVDLDARLRSLRAEESALDALLGRAPDIPQILQVRDRLTGVRTQIEQLVGQQAALQDRAALGTLTVSIRRAGAAVAEPGDGQRRGLGESARTAWHAAEAVVGGMLVVLGALAPFLVLALLAWPVVRRARRRSVAREAQ